MKSIVFKNPNRKQNVHVWHLLTMLFYQQPVVYAQTDGIFSLHFIIQIHLAKKILLLQWEMMGKETMWITKSRAKMQWISVKCTYAEWKVGKMYITLLIFFPNRWQNGKVNCVHFSGTTKKKWKGRQKTTEIFIKSESFELTRECKQIQTIVVFVKSCFAWNKFICHVKWIHFSGLCIIFVSYM